LHGNGSENNGIVVKRECCVVQSNYIAFLSEKKRICGKPPGREEEAVKTGGRNGFKPSYRRAAPTWDWTDIGKIGFFSEKPTGKG
jgi:hypothetical protein